MPVSSKEFLDIQATIECTFTLKHVRDMIIIYSQSTIQISTHNTARSFKKYIYKLSGFGFESGRCLWVIDNLAHRLPSRNKNLVLVVKKYAKADIKVSCPYPV